MRIGEIADFYGVSPKALRIYEKKGIIKPFRIDKQTGYRYYSADQVKQLNSLIELQTLGFSLNEIKEIMVGKLTKEELLQKLDYKRKAWEDAATLAQYRVESIDGITERLEQSHEANRLNAMTEDERAWMLFRMVCVEETSVQSAISEAIWL